MANNTVIVSASSSSPILEGDVGTGITTAPGELVHLQPDGTYTNSFPVGVWANVAYPLVVVENLDQGKDINSTYSAGEKMIMRYLRSGDVFLGWLMFGEGVDVSQFVTVNTVGELQFKVDLSTGDYYFGTALQQVITAEVRKRVKIQVK